MVAENVEEQVERTVVKNNNNSKGKKNKGCLWIIISLFLAIPLLLIVVVGIFVIFVSVFVESQSSKELSEFGLSEVPTEYIEIYQRAGNKYGVDWRLLASIHRMETKFSTLENMESSVGAKGHMQFMVCTWVGWSHPACSGSQYGNANIPESEYTNPSVIAKYGGYGVDANYDGRADPYDIEDAIFSASKMLSYNMKGRTEEDKIRNAIYAYNRADWYVEEVLYYYKVYTEGYSQFVEIEGGKSWILPFTKNITSYFGTRVDPLTGKAGAKHNGIDIASHGVNGQPIVAYTDGIVTYSQYNSGGFGNLVIIDHGNGISTYYAHMRSQGIAYGTEVKAGQVIGHVGSTGDSTGPHLHFEIRVNGTPVDPIPYLSEFLNNDVNILKPISSS